MSSTKSSDPLLLAKAWSTLVSVLVIACHSGCADQHKGMGRQSAAVFSEAGVVVSADRTAEGVLSIAGNPLFLGAAESGSQFKDALLYSMSEYVDALETFAMWLKPGEEAVYVYVAHWPQGRGPFNVNSGNADVIRSLGSAHIHEGPVGLVVMSCKNELQDRVRDDLQRYGCSVVVIPCKDCGAESVEQSNE